jgi:hypothetical protein
VLTISLIPLYALRVLTETTLPFYVRNCKLMFIICQTTDEFK